MAAAGGGAPAASGGWLLRLATNYDKLLNGLENCTECVAADDLFEGRPLV